MSRMIRTPNFSDPDGFYAALVSAHEGLSNEQSELLNARLVLILANHVGDHKVLTEALAAARIALGRQTQSGSEQAGGN